VLLVCFFIDDNSAVDTLTGIRVFIGVVETGSFTAASERMGLSRAAASKHVSQLEARLGGRLLNRTTRHVSTTESGRVYFNRCKEILNNLEEAEGMVSGLTAQPRGTLRITAPTYFASRYLLPLINDFMRTHSELKVELMCAERLVDLVDEGYDLAIRVTNPTDSDLIARRLSSCRHVLVASPEYLARKPIPKTPDDLDGHASLLYAYLPGSLWTFAKDGKDYSVPVSPVVRSNNPDVLLAAAESGMGLALLPTFLVSDSLRSGALRLVLPEYRSIDLSIYAVYASRHHLPAKIKAFVEYLREHIGDPPAWEDF
jgi:DNA-binding transcriptional LysR family regulator